MHAFLLCLIALGWEEAASGQTLKGLSSELQKQTLQTIGDWRCLEGDADEAVWGKYRKAAAFVESHADNPSIGDVCRDFLTTDYFCPVSCRKSLLAPYCTSVEIAADGVVSPCRAPPEAETNAVPCELSDDPTVTSELKLGATLFRRLQKYNHGDVCKSFAGDVWFCPIGCFYSEQAPFCTNKPSSDSKVVPSSPCRVPYISSKVTTLQRPAPLDALSDEQSSSTGEKTGQQREVAIAPRPVETVPTETQERQPQAAVSAFNFPSSSLAIMKYFVPPKTAVTFSFPDTFVPVFGTRDDPLPMLVDVKNLRSEEGDTGHVHVFPYFFHQPKAAGTTIEEILSSKVGLETLPSGDREDLHYIERSQALERGIVQYIKTPLMYDACAFFGRAKIRARAFTILREPVSRMVSLFWYKKNSTWEKDFDVKYKNQSIAEFVATAETNWLMYTIASAVVPKNPSDVPGGGSFTVEQDEVIAAARYVLHTKVVVGFMDDLGFSVPLIFRKFGWEWVAGNDIDKMSQNVHVKSSRPDSADVDALIDQIRKRNLGDVILYNDARKSYEAEKRAWMSAEAKAKVAKQAEIAAATTAATAAA